MESPLVRIMKLLTPWWNEDEAGKKTARTDEVVLTAHSAASEARAVIDSYRAASEVIASRSPRRTNRFGRA